jgi:hypothetical protein
MWSAENPNTFHERPLHSLKVRVWCAVSRWRIIGPIFFSKPITAEHYKELITKSISLLEVNKQDCWFKQEGAIVQTANLTTQILSDFLGGRIIS